MNKPEAMANVSEAKRPWYLVKLPRSVAWVRPVAWFTVVLLLLLPWINPGAPPSARERAYLSENRLHLDCIFRACKNYARENGGQLPASLADLVQGTYLRPQDALDCFFQDDEIGFRLVLSDINWQSQQDTVLAIPIRHRPGTPYSVLKCDGTILVMEPSEKPQEP